MTLYKSIVYVDSLPMRFKHIHVHLKLLLFEDCNDFKLNFSAAIRVDSRFHFDIGWTSLHR